MPSTQPLSNRSLASDPLISGAKGAPRSCPAGSITEVGLCAARRRADAAATNAHLADFASKPENHNRRLLLRRKAEDGILPGPFSGQIGEASYPHAC